MCSALINMYQGIPVICALHLSANKNLDHHSLDFAVFCWLLLHKKRYSEVVTCFPQAESRAEAKHFSFLVSASVALLCSSWFGFVLTELVCSACVV